MTRSHLVLGNVSLSDGGLCLLRCIWRRRCGRWLLYVGHDVRVGVEGSKAYEGWLTQADFGMIRRQFPYRDQLLGGERRKSQMV